MVQAARLLTLEGATDRGPIGVLDDLEQLAELDDRFGVLVDLGGVEADQGAASAGGRRAVLRRIRALRAVMSTHSVGLAFVTDDAGAGRRTRAAQLMFGCPVAAFDDRSSALRWLAGLGVDTSEIGR